MFLRLVFLAGWLWGVVLRGVRVARRLGCVVGWHADLPAAVPLNQEERRKALRGRHFRAHVGRVCQVCQRQTPGVVRTLRANGAR